MTKAIAPFKQGDIVAVLYDGKVTRAIQGKVEYITPTGRSMTVKFKPWANEEVGFIRMDCKPCNPKWEEVACLTHRQFSFYGGLVVGKGESGIQRLLSGYSGDYYVVVPESVILDEGYPVEPYDRNPYK